MKDKIVILVDGSKENFDKMVDTAGKQDSIFINTENCDELKEYDYLLNTIDEFSHSNRQVMLAKFSGRESIIRNIGEERPEMIVSLSYNPNSKYYSACPTDMFSELINIFEKETSN